MSKILIVDDDKIFCKPLSLYIEGMGHSCDVAEKLHIGLKMANQNDYDIIFLDVVLPDISGLEGINDFKKMPSLPEVIIITGYGDSHGAETALVNGAWDYLEKPPSYSNIKLLLERALQYREKKFQFRKKMLLNRVSIIGNNSGLIDCLETAARASASNESVYITGETGTGKELIARAIHDNSSRANKNFVPVDCTNIPPNLAESILFGHIKGSFTGAEKTEEGLISQADEGTLFLDEVGDLGIPIQKSLLRVLQEKKYRALGSNQEKSCDFRVITASNRNLKKMIEHGQFRKDLYYRLVVFQIELPPLRKRKDDIKLLTHHYIYKICDSLGINTIGISKDFVEALKCHDWPGNIRELLNIMHTTIANAIEEPVLYPQHLPLDLRVSFKKRSIQAKNITTDKVTLPTFHEYKENIESKYLDDLITLCNGDSVEACRLSGISRSGLYNLLKKHGKKLKS